MSGGDRRNKKTCALILGGGMNGYNTARELNSNGVKNLILFAEKKNYACYSNIWAMTQIVPPDAEALYRAIESLRADYDYVVTYPVSDSYLVGLYAIHSDIEDFCYIGFNPSTIHRYFGKSKQYDFCKKYDIAHPRTENLEAYLSSQERKLAYPLLIKPDAWSQNALQHKVFKTLILNTEEELNEQAAMLFELIHKGVNLLITEVIPGDDDAIYGYVAYRSKSGEILNEWMWRKLSQHPEGYGVFSTISNQGTESIKELGRDVFHKMNLQGINEIEFKYDSRDSQYKYIETNFRTPMLIRLGHLTGVDVCYTQYLDALGITPKTQAQNQDEIIHYVVFRSELQNLAARAGYATKFWHNIFGSDRTYFSLFDSSDMGPMIHSVVELLQAAVRNHGSKRPS